MSVPAALSAADRRPVSERLPAAAHLRAALPADGGRRAGRRSHHRHGAAAARLRGRLRRHAAGLRDRLLRADHARPSSSTTAATTWCCAASRSSRFTSEEAPARRTPLSQRGDHADRRVDAPPAIATRSAASAKKLQRLLAPLFSEGLGNRLPEAMPDEDLSTRWRSTSSFEPMEKLALLERPGPLARCRSMVELLEMKAMAGGTGSWEPGTAH